MSDLSFLFFESRYSEFLQTALIGLVVALVSHWLRPRGRLRWGSAHSHAFLMSSDQGPGYLLRTQSFWFQNTGKSSLDDVEIILNYPPQHFEIWPARQFERRRLDNGRLLIAIPFLSAHEGITLSMLDARADLPEIVGARARSGPAKEIPMTMQRQWPTWTGCVAIALLALGTATVLRAVILVVL